jgi:serine/threonine-protein kinase
MAQLIERLGRVLGDRYVVKHELGAGGMATVFLAEDVRHGRSVAVKVLARELAETLGADRFLREIEIAGRLSHPRIVPLLDSGAADGVLFYVMPYIDGRSLRERLERERQLPVDEAVEIARQTALALAYAHDHGVVHRDIKPGNILLTAGEALVTDFGIARAVSAAGGPRMTGTGMAIGTPAYMSPEQASGSADIDGRTDVYALGCVLYEMLAGDVPFTGATAQAIMARKLTEPAPDVTAIRESVPPEVAATLRRALARVPADRHATAKQFADSLPAAARSPGHSTAFEAMRPRFSRGRGLVGVGLLTGLVAIAAWGWLRPHSQVSFRPVRMTANLPAGVRVARDPALGSALALSPDGSTLVIVGTGESGPQLYRRSLDRLDAAPIPGTEGAGSPFFSPDGAWLGFFAYGRLWRVPPEGGAPVYIASAPGPPMGASWGRDDRIVFSSGYRSPLVVVPAEGGTPERLTVLDSGGGGVSHRHPELLPDGRTLLFVSFGGVQWTVEALDLSTGRRRTLTNGVAPRYASGGRVIVARGNTLLAAELDPSRLALVSPVAPIAEGVLNEMQFAAVHYATAPNATLAYVQGSDRPSLVLSKADGTERFIFDEQRRFSHPRFAPDGTALTVIAAGEVWIYDLREEVASRLTFDGAQAPIWMPDASTITFERLGVGLHNKRTDGSGDVQELLRVSEWAQPVGWTPDGKMLAFSLEAADGTSCIAVLAEGGHHCVAGGPSRVWIGRLSSDGRWLAYQSDETGTDEVYVTPFPEGGTRWQVSVQGGSGPAWSTDGSELYYRSRERLVASRVDPANSFRVLSRRTVLESFLVAREDDYDVHPDGETVVMARPLDSRDRSDIVIVLNWEGEPTP